MFAVLTIIVGLALVAYGLVQIFAKDTAWRWHVWQQERKADAKTPERTPEWERTITWGGLIVMVLGAVSVGLGVIELMNTGL